VAPGPLFDASVLVDLLIRTEGRTVGVNVVFDEVILDLTVYDAAYLAVAERDELAVVTEDRALREACVREEIPVKTVADLAE